MLDRAMNIPLWFIGFEEDKIHKFSFLLETRNTNHRKIISAIWISTFSKLNKNLHVLWKYKRRSKIDNCNKYGNYCRSIDAPYINVG